RALREMPVVEQSWLAGSITDAHVGLLAGARTAETAEVFARDEELLCGHARTLRFSQFVRAPTYWRHRADPEGSEKDASEDGERRRLHFSQSWGGRFFAEGVFDPIRGTIIDRELKRLETELFEEDWAEARARLGDGASASDLGRSPAQRRR